MADRPSPPDWPATAAVAGRGQGRPLLLEEPLSFWGGYDAAAGRIVEASHPQHGQSLIGRVMLMASAKGSSSSSSVLAEAIRSGTGPAAIVMRERDLIVGLGCIVASELYGIHVPVLVVACEVWEDMTERSKGASPDWGITADGCGECSVRMIDPMSERSTAVAQGE
jgi:predicted aconitase with swiveling domain